MFVNLDFGKRGRVRLSWRDIMLGWAAAGLILAGYLNLQRQVNNAETRLALCEKGLKAVAHERERNPMPGPYHGAGPADGPPVTEEKKR